MSKRLIENAISCKPFCCKLQVLSAIYGIILISYDLNSYRIVYNIDS